MAHTMRTRGPSRGQPLPQQPQQHPPLEGSPVQKHSAAPPAKPRTLGQQGTGGLERRLLVNRTAPGHDAHRGAPLTDKGREARGGGSPASASKVPAPRPHCRGRARPFGTRAGRQRLSWLSAPRERTTGQPRNESRWPGAAAALPVPWRGQRHAQRMPLPRSSALQPPQRGQPSGSDLTAKALGMLVPCGGAPKPALRLRTVRRAGWALPGQTRATPRWQAAGHSKAAGRWQRLQAACRRLGRLANSCLPDGCCK